MIVAVARGRGCARQERRPRRQPAQTPEGHDQLPDAQRRAVAALPRQGRRLSTQKHGLDVDLQFGVHPAGVAMLTSGQAVRW